jgi:hypothetical protein
MAVVQVTLHGQHLTIKSLVTTEVLEQGQQNTKVPTIVCLVRVAKIAG